MGDFNQVYNMNMAHQPVEGNKLLLQQAYTNQNWLQDQPQVLGGNPDYSAKEVYGKALSAFEQKEEYVLAGYNTLDGYYDPNGLRINKAMGI